jgi:hypothetical protein
MPAPLRYRGISYAPRGHQQLSAQPVEHVYRGHRYSTPLLRPAATASSRAELHYRGVTYRHQAARV